MVLEYIIILQIGEEQPMAVEWFVKLLETRYVILVIHLKKEKRELK